MTTDRDMLEICKQHFAFLGKVAQQPYLYHNKKRVSPKQVIVEECQAAIDRLNQHLNKETK